MCCQITANPADINILPEYSRDPRVVTNLIDGVNRTRDDIHMWLAPFTMGQEHSIHIVFQQPTQIAMMRIWVRSGVTLIRNVLSCFTFDPF